MKLRQFINELEDLEMDFDVEVNLVLNNDVEELSIESIESKIYGKILLDVDLTDYVLIDKSRLNELEEAEYMLDEIRSHQ